MVKVRVRVAAGLVEVTMPKSSSLGLKAMGFGVAIVVGIVTVWVVALSACAVTLPGLLEVLVTDRMHSAPAGRVVGQLWASAKLVALS